MYKTCSRFKNSGDKELCGVLSNLGGFLHQDWGLDMRKHVDEKIEEMSETKDHNEEYQDVLELLYNMGVGTLDYRKITKDENGYTQKTLKKVGRVRDEHGKWMAINKLNTNYSDLAELITELFVRHGKVPAMLNFFKKNGVAQFKNYLLEHKESLHKSFDTYFPEIDEYHDFTNNIKHMSSTGDETENYAKGILEKIGFKTVYQGGDGDFIDMIYGVDLIMEWKGKNYLIQVKTRYDQLKELHKQGQNKKYYRYINLFISKRDNTEGIMIIDRSENINTIDGDGKTESKTDKNGKVRTKKT